MASAQEIAASKKGVIEMSTKQGAIGTSDSIDPGGSRFCHFCHMKSSTSILLHNLEWDRYAARYNHTGVRRIFELAHILTLFFSPFYLLLACL